MTCYKAKKKWKTVFGNGTKAVTYWTVHLYTDYPCKTELSYPGYKPVKAKFVGTKDFLSNATQVKFAPWKQSYPCCTIMSVAIYGKLGCMGHGLLDLSLELSPHASPWLEVYPDRDVIPTFDSGSLGLDFS